MFSINETISQLLQFYGMAFDEKIAKFIQTHTTHQKGHLFSTYRNSTTVPFAWMKKLSFTEVNEIQENCREAIALWGYKEATNAIDLASDFNPLLPFDDFDQIK
jgi:hypothetical protein